MDFSNQTVIVTGAGRGIGKATAHAFAVHGARTVLCDISDSCMEIAEDLNHQGYLAKGIVANVSNRDAVASMVAQTLDAYGPVDILVNNAGITRDARFGKLTEELWDQVMSVNLKSMFFTCQEVLTYMVPRKTGKIINIASISAQTGNYGQCNYGAAKAGVEGLTRCLCKEYATSGIRVNAVAPGFTSTEMTQAIPPEIREQMIRTIPQGRAADPSEIAGAILFLASDYASYINGQTINVNGGTYM